MGKRPTGIDSAMLDLLVSTEDARTLFTSLGCPVAYWEAIRLAQTEVEHLTQERERMERLQARGRTATIGTLLIGTLRNLRARHGGHARRLHALLKDLALPQDPMLDEMVVGMLLASEEGMKKADDWLARGSDDDRVREEVATYSATIEDYRQGLIDWRSGGLVEVAAEPLDVPGRIDEDVLEDLRTARRLHAFRNTAQPEMEPWEELSLALSDRSGVDRAVDRFDAHRRGEPPTDLNDDLIRFFERLLELRMSRAALARDLRTYVASLPLGRFSPGTLDLALGFVLASPEGRERVRAWLDLPDRYRREAAIRLEGVIGRAQAYEQALSA